MKLPLSQLEEALRARELSRMDAIQKAGQTMPVDDSDVKEFEMVLKKKRMAGILQSALREGGNSDLAKMVRFKQSEEQH